MADRPETLLRHLRRLATVPAADTDPDAELLRRYVRHREEEAFAALVRRHGGLVLGVCRRVLGDAHRAEDAFQAAWLVFARKAATVRPAESLAGWLHGVARRTARNVLRGEARRRKYEAEGLRAVSAPVTPDPLDELTARELLLLLDEEVRRLPESNRLPVLYCCWEGLSHEEAAQRLGWTAGSVKGRLERGRRLLHARLAKRGLALSAALAVFDVSRGVTGVPAALVADTVRAALAGPVPVGVAALADGALRGVMPGKCKIALALLLALGAATLGAGVVLSPPAVEGLQGEPNAGAEKAAPKTSPAPVRAGKDLYGDPLPPRALARLGTVRFRHGEQVSRVVLSPDGRTLASASRDKTARLWDLATGKELQRFGPEDSDVFSVAFSPDGTLLAIIREDFKGVSVREAKTGREVKRLLAPRNWFNQVLFSPDGKTLAAAGYNHRIPLWDVESGRFLRCLDGKEDTSFPPAIAFSPDGRTLASGRLGREIQLWDATTGEGLRRLKIPPPREAQQDVNASTAYVYGLQFSPDGKLLASSGVYQDVCLWEAATGKEIRRWPAGKTGTNRLAFSPDGRLLATLANTGLVRLREAATGKEVLQFQTAREFATDVLFSRDGQTLVISAASSISLWDVRTGKEILPDRGHTAGIGHFDLSPDQRTLTTTSADGTIRQWDLATGRELRCLPAPGSSHRAAVVSPDGKIVASFLDKRVSEKESQTGVRLWESATKKELAVLWRPNIFNAFFSPDGKTLFTAGWDVKERKAFLNTWEAATGKSLRGLIEPSNPFEHLTLSADGKLLAAVVPGQKKSILLWQVDTGKEQCRLPGDREFNQALAFAPGRNLLAVLDGSRPMLDSRVMTHHIHLWDVTTGKKAGDFGSSSGGHWPGTFSPDGRTLATAGEDKRIHLWEVATGAERLTLQGHTGWVGNLLFAEQGRTLISASDDTTALVWDVSGWRRGDAAKKQRPSRADLETLWADLKNPDAAKAGRAVWALAAAPRDAVPFLGEKLRPARPADPQQVLQLLSDLHSDRFPVRAKAEQEIAKLEELAEPYLRKELAKGPPVEVRRRVEKLLDPLEKVLLTGERLRTERAVEVLEHVGNPEARRLLQGLAGGAPAARLTHEARASLERLSGPSRHAP